jgi:AraC family transcriptional regulator, exoenzyme S synthesis regulatory protein ExsA
LKDACDYSAIIFLAFFCEKTYISSNQICKTLSKQFNMPKVTAVNFYEDIRGNPAKFRQLTCKELLFAHYNCPQVDIKKEFFSQYNFISYTFGGEKRMHKAGKSWYLESDVAIFARKGAYLFEKYENVEHCVMMFFIPDSYLQKFVREYPAELAARDQRPVDSVVSLDLTETTKAFFNSMISYFNEPPAENILELKFKELLLNLVSNPRNKGLATVLYNHSTGKPSLEEIMEDNYLYNLTIEDFAKIAFRSVASFKRDFKAAFQTTPGKWLLRKRLENANQLLHTTNKSVSEIAFESGFENNTHFSRVFKDQYGMSPFHHRKQAGISA